MVQRYSGPRAPGGFAIDAGTLYERHRCRPVDLGYRVQHCPDCEVVVRLLLDTPRALGQQLIEYGTTKPHRCDPVELKRRNSNPSWGPIGSLADPPSLMPNTLPVEDEPPREAPPKAAQQQQTRPPATKPGVRIRTGRVLTVRPEENP